MITRRCFNFNLSFTGSVRSLSLSLRLLSVQSQTHRRHNFNNGDGYNFSNNKIEVDSTNFLLKLPLQVPLRRFRTGMSEAATEEPGTATGSGKKASEGDGMSERRKCIFCKITDGLEDNEIFYQDEEFVVFQDIKPAAKHHLLVVPREHIRDSKCLLPNQLPLLEKLIQIGDQVLAQQLKDKDNGAELGSVKKLSGFHWPPFHTVNHLHLHVIAPADQMGFVSRAIFRPNSYWFVTPDYVRSRLEKMLENQNGNNGTGSGATG